MAIDEQRIIDFLGAFPEEFMGLSESGKRLSAEIYKLLVRGKPVELSQLAASVDLPLSEVKEILGNWNGIFYDEAGSIIAYWAISLVKMPHRFDVDGVRVYACCAWDALYIPAIIGKTATVSSLDPLSKEKITIRVSPNGIESLSPEGAAISFLMPETEEIQANVIMSFCKYIHFFASEEGAKLWVGASEKRDNLVILSIDEGYKIGAMKNDLQYGGTLSETFAS